MLLLLLLRGAVAAAAAGVAAPAAPAPAAPAAATDLELKCSRRNYCLNYYCAAHASAATRTGVCKERTSTGLPAARAICLAACHNATPRSKERSWVHVAAVHVEGGAAEGAGCRPRCDGTMDIITRAAAATHTSFLQSPAYCSGATIGRSSGSTTAAGGDFISPAH